MSVNGKKGKTIFLTEQVLSQHSRITLYNKVYANLKNEGIEFEIIALREPPEWRGNTKKTDLIPNVINLTKHTNNLFRFIKLFFILVWNQPRHLTVGGYAHVEYWLALIYCKIFRIPFTFYTGGSEERSRRKSKIIYALKKYFVRSARKYIAYGSRASEYLQNMGIEKKDIYIGVNVSDIEYFKEVSAKYINTEEYKKTLSSHNRPIIVFCGQLNTRKGIQLLLDKLTYKSLDDYYLYVLGSGELKTFVEKQFQEEKVTGSYLGQVDAQKIAQVFSLADVYISPSINDPFSRTLSEALACNCFCISSKYDDASYDLINDKNGIIFDPKSNEEFNNVLDKIISLDWRQIDKGGIVIPAGISCDNYANQITNGIINSYK